ncbi:MAG: ribosomal protein L11 methyltransferase [Rhizobiales bacterium 62-47]|nr:50S ribosomal protein L11 methyltransferase [Hyphomicrobiales bacterium]OJY12021.1 MAG: ribosomal protein L11 methyltransferase [Rhizobiales bacterium 62-47]
MNDFTTPATIRAVFTVGAEQSARQIVDRLEESIDPGEVVVAAFETTDNHWDVTLYFSQPPDRPAIRDLVAATSGDEIAATIQFETIEAKDWVKSSLEGLAPVPAGRFVVYGQHDRERVPSNKLGIEIEAALAFGTGHHGTTRGCLLLLDQVLKQRTPNRILDLGSGTGVLAIAAAKALHRGVLATDIDARSAIVAAENARLNGVGNLVESICAKGFAAPQLRERAPFDLIMANILANPLRQMAPTMAAHLAPSGLLILSGLLPHQAAGVVAAYRAVGVVLLQKIQLTGWSSLLLRYPG